MRLCLIPLLVCVCSAAAIGQPKVTPESRKAMEFWSAHVKDKPSNLILGDRRIIRMYLFSGQAGIPSKPRDVAIADMLHKAGGSYALRGSIGEKAFLMRAAEMSGRTPDEKQYKAMATLSKKVIGKYSAMRPKGGAAIMLGTFGIAGVANLHHTLKSTRTMEDAFAKVARYHGWNCDLRKLTDVPFEVVKESLDRDRPLLFKKDKVLYACFGYVFIGDEPHLLLNEPGTTPLVSGPPFIPPGSRESVSSFVIRHWRRRLKAGRTMPRDIVTEPSLALPPAGFRIEPYEAKGWTVWVVENWKYSAEAWDKEIRAALDLEDVPAPTQADIPPTGRHDEDLWNKYILGRTEKVGGPYGLVPVTVIPPGWFDQDRAALFSVIASQMGSRPSELAFTVPRLYRWACTMKGEMFLDLDKQKLEQLQALYEKILKQYELNQRSVRADADVHPNAVYAAALRLNAAVKNAQTLPSMLKNIEKNNGWAATLESAKSMPFAAYKKAINRGVQVLVMDKGGRWRIVVGYLDIESGPMLLVVDPSLIGRRVLTLDRDRLFPPAGVYFEKFNAGRYSVIMLHGWRISADPYATELNKIFKATSQPTSAPARVDRAK